MKEAKVIHTERQYQQHSQPVPLAWHPERDMDRNATILQVGLNQSCEQLVQRRTISWPILLRIWQIEAAR